MLDETPDTPTESGAQAADAAPQPEATAQAPVKKAAAKKAPAKKAAAKKAPAKKAPAKKAATHSPTPPGDTPDADATSSDARAAASEPAAAKSAAKKTAAKKAAEKKAPAEKTAAKKVPAKKAGEVTTGATAETPEKKPVSLLFQPPEAAPAPARKAPAKKTAAAAKADKQADDAPGEVEATAVAAEESPARRRASKATATDATDATEAVGGEDSAASTGEDDDSGQPARRRRRRGGRRRRKAGGDSEAAEGSDASETSDGGDDEAPTPTASDDVESDGDDGDQGSGAGSRRRRRRRRAGEGDGSASDDPDNTVTRVRKGRSAEDEITSLSGSTRLEAKKQRRREGREAGRRRAPIVSEAEFLARRESVERVMVVRQRDDLTQIAVLEDGVLVEHYVARESQTSLIGNVYLGRVQNVLPSMEAAFIDIGKGRNAVLYAGEVNWAALGAVEGQPRKIESVLKSGQSVLVQVTKDPVGQKGARLTGQVSLPGRFLVYVPDGTTSGISRKLADTERNRLKTLLKEIVPDTAGVIVRTAAEGASETELRRDVERLKARWEDIEAKVKKGNAPELLYGEPDLTLKVVRDLFTEDFAKLVVAGEDAWDVVHGYVSHVAPDLADRLEKYDGDGDAFASYRIDEQIAKGLDRKVWLPSGGSLVIDRTEAMTVVDVNTGKFTGSGGNLEETVTKNNLEAAEEIVRQLRLRDIGGIIVVDFIDMVLESNRDLVLRRLIECLGRDRTRHQVAEVTSLGLVQMTRKRIGTGLLEAFSETCSHCGGRGLIVHQDPVEPTKQTDDDAGSGRGRGRRRRGSQGSDAGEAKAPAVPSPSAVAAIAKPENAGKPPVDEDAAEAEAEADEAVEAVEQTPLRSSESSPADLDELEPLSMVELDGPVEQAVEEPEPEPEPEPGPATTGPVVVTSTRRRTARRAAGPPAVGVSSAAAGHDGAPRESEGSSAVPVLTAEPPPPPEVTHVPIKKRGRKR